MGIKFSSAVILFLLVVIVPYIAGLPFAEKIMKSAEKKAGFEKQLSAVVCGYIVLWAAFQLVAVPFILTTDRFDSVYKVFSILIFAVVLSVIVWKIVTFRKKAKESSQGKKDPVWNLSPGKKENLPEKRLSTAVWIIFSLLVVFQVVMSTVMAFADGDDAFYIPISQNAVTSGRMYHTIPYTGEITSLDLRHGLAPFPIWIAFLGKASGIPATVLAQSVLGGVLLLLCYAVYGMIAGELFRNKKEGIPYFMCFTAILFTFGNYSLYSAETFLMTRTSQGKAVLANILIPFFIWCLLRLAGDEKENRVFYFLLVFASAASWLCSTMGIFFSVMMTGIGGLVISTAQKSIKKFIRFCLCMVPSVVFAVLYLRLQ